MTAPSNPIEINNDISFVLKEVKTIQDSLLRLIDWTCHLQNKINELHSEYTNKQSKTPLVSSGTKSHGSLHKFHQTSNTTSSISNHSTSSRNEKNKKQDKNNKKDSAASIMMVHPSTFDNNNNNKYNHSVTGGNKRTPLDLDSNKNDEQEKHSCKDGYLESLLLDDESSTASNDMSILTSSEFSLLPCQQLLHSSTMEKEEQDEESSSSSSDSHHDRRTSTRSYVRSSSKHEDTAAETLLRKSIKTTNNYKSNLSVGHGGATSQLFSSPVAIFSSTTRIPSTATATATSNYYIHPSPHITCTSKQENKEDSEEHILYDQFKSPALDDFSCNDSLYADVDLFDSQKEFQLPSFEKSDKKDIIGAGTLRRNIHTTNTSTTELYEYSKKKKTGTMTLKHKMMRAKWQLKYVLSKLRKQQL